METDAIEVTPLSKPDDDWEFTDKSGHLHRWQNDKLPSLRIIIDCPADEEYPADTHFECKRYGEIINPGYKSPACREFMPGLSRFFIDDTEIEKSEFEKEYHIALSKAS